MWYEYSFFLRPVPCYLFLAALITLSHVSLSSSFPRSLLNAYFVVVICLFFPVLLHSLNISLDRLLFLWMPKPFKMIFFYRLRE